MLLLVFSISLSAQATRNTSASVTILTPLAITELSPLNFGTMSVSEETGGVCILSTLGVRSPTEGVNLSEQSPSATNASYTITGDVNATYIIDLPESITVNNEISGATMIITFVQARPSSTGSDGLIGTLSSSGTDSFTVGGTLNVEAGQDVGYYDGNFLVTVSYN